MKTRDRHRPGHFCAGHSMEPTLKPLDPLRIEPYGDNAVQRGDVVVFRSPVTGERVVHRVMAVGKRGIRTRGDNNRSRDPWHHAPNEILGRVIAKKRDGRWIAVPGGFRGHLRSRALHGIAGFKGSGYGLLKAVYPLFRKYLQLSPPVIGEFRTAAFKCGKNIEYRLLWGSKVVARRAEGNNRWTLQKPFVWFLKESALPEPPRQNPIKPSSL